MIVDGVYESDELRIVTEDDATAPPLDTKITRKLGDTGQHLDSIGITRHGRTPMATPSSYLPIYTAMSGSNRGRSNVGVAC